MTKAVYAGYPTAFVFAEPDSKSKKIAHLLWGTWIEHQGEEDGDWAKVRVRGWDVNRQKKIGWMRKRDFQENKILEVYFVDVAQGDGCLVITPDDKFQLIDAGEGRNMAAFLRWKFNLKRFPGNLPIENTIISHSDSDHYKGFLEVVKEPKIKFQKVYHNGLVERTGDDLLGARDGDFCTDIIVDDAALDAIIGDAALVGRKNYPTLMKKLRENGASIKMLCSEDQYLPGYDQTKDLRIRVLAPVPDKDAAGKRTLRWFGDNGKTKNGHSVVVKLEYKNVKILLGGDLNIPAENHILKHYTGIDPEKANAAQTKTLITEARKIFEVDAAKACHHGSADFSNVFLQSLNSAATVISSGDEEPHAHPRPDAVGALGKFGRGNRPLIFSTELARSTKDLIIKPNPTKQELGRTVAVYGMIDLRTDGEKIVIAQKLEQAAPRGEWDFYELEPDKNGVISYKSKHDSD
ncbi:MAG: ComEC/Rec2 family competence protein [Pyrinomonadaceae bacterium]